MQNIMKQNTIIITIIYISQIKKAKNNILEN